MDKHVVAVQACDGGITSKELSSFEDGLMKCRYQNFKIVDEAGKPVFSGNGEAVTRLLHFKASTAGWAIDGYKAVDGGGTQKLKIVFKER